MKIFIILSFKLKFSFQTILIYWVIDFQYIPTSLGFPMLRVQKISFILIYIYIFCVIVSKKIFNSYMISSIPIKPK